MDIKRDNVKHPSHYAEGRKFEPKDVIRDWGLNFNMGNAVKYLARAGRKDDIVQDLKKAQEYIQFEIDAIEAERAKNQPKSDPVRNPVFTGVKSIAIIGTPREQIIRRIIKEIYEKG